MVGKGLWAGVEEEGDECCSGEQGSLSGTEENCNSGEL